jgi:hypothetical protein
MTLACWSACDRITSALDTGPTLTPEELPTQGTTPLPSLGSPPPDVRLASGGDVRSQFLNKPTGNQSALDIDHAVLKQYMLTMAEIFDSPHPSVMIRADTSASGWFSYGYATLRFPQQEIQRSQGHREVFVYVLPDSSGIKRLNVALLPKTPDAFLAYRKWLLPYVDPDKDDQEMPASLQHKPLNQQTAGMVQICFEWTQLACVGIPGVGESCTLYYYTACYWAENTSFMEEGPDGGFGDPSGPPDPCIGNDCGGDTAGAFGCDGDPGAFKDHCGRCVGGNTGRLAAKPGDDCDTLNLPCAGDVVKNPEITSSGASGKTGGRFRPCVEGVSPGGGSGWGATCTNDDRAVRNNGQDAHHGLDITCNVGDPIFAPFDLHSANAGSLPGVGYGNFMRGWTTIDGVEYSFGIAHLQSKPSIPPDGKFKKGDIIGYCGRSGIPNTASGRRVTTHVHLEMGTESTLSRLSRVFFGPRAVSSYPILV